MMQPHVQQAPAPYPAHYAPASPRPFVREPQRNVVLVGVGALLLIVALAAAFAFLMNLNQYLTIEDRWASDPLLSPAARDFGVRIIKDAALKRMMMFGPASGLFGIAGLVLGLLGLRKK